MQGSFIDPKKIGYFFSKFSRKIITLVLIFSLLIQSLIVNIPSAYAASSPWTQTDWSGGSGQTSFSDATKYSSTSSVDTSTTAGQATLTNTEQLTNTGFESNLNSWSYSADQTLTTSGNEITDATRTTNTSGDGVTSPDSSYGIWEATTNLVSNGGFETNTTGYTATGSTVTRVTTQYKFGAASGEVVTNNAAANEGAYHNFTATATVYAISAWVRGSSGTVRMAVADSTGANRQTGTAVTLSTTWQRITLITTSLTAATWRAIIETNSQQGITFQVDGVQAELQPVATPYVETNGGTASRAVGNTAIPASLINPTQGWFAMRVRLPSSYPGGTTRYAEAGTGFSSSKWLSVTSGNSTTSMGRGTIANPNPNNANISSAAFAGQMRTVVGAWTATQVMISVDGSAFATNSNTDIPTNITGNIRISNDVSGVQPLDGTFLWFAAGTGTLTDANAATINGFGNTDPTLGSLPSSASTSAVWAADTSTYTAGSVSRDTSTTYSSSVASARVISSQTTGNFTQSVNVGDTNTYNLSAYAYTDGSAVTSSDLSLLYNGSTISTTYTSVGSGWYKLSGTLTGANAARNYGVQVASGKTVYVDNFSLNRYATSGTLTSSIFDAENTNEGNNWGVLTYSATTPTNTSVTVKARTSDSSTMVGATDFSTCTAITTGADISSNNCVTDSHRYIQYEVTLAATDTSVTPTFSDISIAFGQRDTTGPVSIELDSPGDNSYTSNERPTFRWKATSDATSGLSKYVLEIDNPLLGSDQPSGDFTIDNIPTSRTTDYETNKYIIHYENLNDSDSTNNYISIHTKSHADWGISENDGKLREGKVNWKVKAVDNSGNETSSSRTLFVDKTSPNVGLTQINSTPYISNIFSTTDRTPTIFGKITDTLAGADNNGQTKQDENGPKIASGPKEVNIKVERKQGLIYTLVTLYKINMESPYYTCDPDKTIDNAKQKCDKYLPFGYTPEQNLDLGTYKITISGKDKADNPTPDSGQVLTLNIGTFDQIATSEEKQALEEKTKNLTPSEKQKIQEEQEITKPIEPNIVQQAGKNIVSAVGNFISTIFTGIGNGVKFVAGGIGSGLVFVLDTTGQVIAFRNEIITTFDNTTKEVIGSSLAYVGQGYSNVAQKAPGVTRDVLLTIGNGVNATSNLIGATTSGVEMGIHGVGQIVNKGANNIANGTRNGIANAVFVIGEKTDDVSHGLGTAIIKVGYLFVPEPTTISNVKVIKSTPNSMTIIWKTNHPATGKVNFGLTEDYGQDMQSDKRVNNHEFAVTGLKPDTTYYYEVMSQNRNYVYDARHTFTTPAK